MVKSLIPEYSGTPQEFLRHMTRLEIAETLLRKLAGIYGKGGLSLDRSTRSWLLGPILDLWPGNVHGRVTQRDLLIERMCESLSPDDLMQEGRQRQESVDVLWGEPVKLRFISKWALTCLLLQALRWWYQTDQETNNEPLQYEQEIVTEACRLVYLDFYVSGFNRNNIYFSDEALHKEYQRRHNRKRRRRKNKF